jgi:hypothetical protein
MFEFVITDALLAIYESMLKEVDTFEEFLGYSILQLDGLLDHSLTRIRTRLRNEGAARLASMFMNLLAEVKELREVAQTHELTAAITAAGTDVQTVLGRITGWFRRGDSTIQEPFELDEAVAIGQELARGRRRVSAQVIEQNGTPFRIAGPYFSHYVDVFFTAFANVAERSRVEDPMAEVKLTFRADGLLVRIENSIGDDVRTSEAEAKLDRIRTIIASGRTTPDVSGEGGTGLLKIANSLSKITEGWTVDFGFDGSDRFVLELFTPLVRTVRS